MSDELQAGPKATREAINDLFNEALNEWGAAGYGRDTLFQTSFTEVVGKLKTSVLAELAYLNVDMPTIWEDPAGKGYPCFERPMTPAEARDTIDELFTRIITLEDAAASPTPCDPTADDRG